MHTFVYLHAINLVILRYY